MRLLVCLLFMCLCHSASALEFWQQATSLRLLNTTGTTDDYQSEVNSLDFFISGKKGQTDPKLEWQSTIDAFTALSNTPVTQADLRCKYPARWLWLKQNHYFLNSTFELSQCTEFAKWAHLSELNSISLMLASGYLGNPASYYGHLLLKLDFSSDNNIYDLLDTSVNYGALVDPSDNGITYIIKGLLGGYEAAFTHLDFYHHQHNYGENELRDLWQYQLNLTAEQNLLIVAHLWELKDAHFTYYFMRENCAYQLALLLELAVNKELFNRNIYWILPHQIISKLTEHGHLVHAITQIPSRQSRLFEHAKHLNTQQLKRLKQAIKQPKHTANLLSDLNDKHHNEVIEVLLDYWQLLEIDSGESYQKQKTYALLARLKRPSGKVIWPESEAHQPHKAQSPSLVRLGISYQENAGTGFSVQMRPAYYDRLGSDIAKPAYASLSMLDFTLGFYNQQLILEDLRLVKLESHALKTGLPNEPGNTWRMNFGLKQQRDPCEHCWALDGTVGIGKSTRLSHSGMGWIMLNTTLEAPSEHYLYLSVDSGISYDVTTAWRNEWVANAKMNASLTPSYQWDLAWNQRLTLTKDYDLRFSVNYMKPLNEAVPQWRTQLSSSFYF